VVICGFHSVKGFTFRGEKLEQCLVDTLVDPSFWNFFPLQKILEGNKQIVIGDGARSGEYDRCDRISQLSSAIFWRVAKAVCGLTLSWCSMICFLLTSAGLFWVSSDSPHRRLANLK